MRLGLLGGTFDPIHRGHLEAGRAARVALGLDRVLFVPCHVPPHRERAPHSSGFHRFAMTALAVLGEEGFVVSDLELSRAGPSYSYDTLTALGAAGWGPTQLFFIAGVDAFAEIATWHRYPALLDTSHFVVVTRPGYAPAQVRARLPELAPRFVEVSAGAPVSRPLDRPPTAVILLDAVTANVSSTEVRRRLVGGEPLDDLLPRDVARYIHQHRLYEPSSPVLQLHGQV